MRILLAAFFFVLACSPSRPHAPVAVDAGTSAPEAASLDPARADEAVAVDGMERIAIINDVADCTSLKLERLVALGNVEVGTFSVRSIKSRGECGCMSSVLAYHVMEKVDLGEEARAAGAEEEYERVYGTVELRAADSTVSLVLATDRRHYANVPLTLKVNCKGPD